jgi:hypothetical protein
MQDIDVRMIIGDLVIILISLVLSIVAVLKVSKCINFC